MADSKNIVADPAYPGSTLEPNDEFIPDNPGLEQFGQELPRPNNPAPVQDAVKVDEQGKPLDPTLRGRYEFHQQRADLAENKLKEIQKELESFQQAKPLLELLRTDQTLRETINSHLSGGKKQPATQEAPQRPQSYNEVEAYSAPDSESFKYRVAMERYKDSRLEMLEKANADFARRQQEEREAYQQQAAQREAQQRFIQDVVSLGVPKEEVASFLGLVNNATKEDMVDYWRYKTGKANAPRFNVPPQGSYPGRPAPDAGYTGPMDISESLLEQARTLR